MFDNYIWVEKYRPRKFDEVILPHRIIEGAKKFVEKGTIPNMMFAGPAGIGKTTLAIVMCIQMDYDYLIVNCSDEGRLLDTFRNKVANFATAISIDGKRKCIILDEIDNLTHDVQSLLRGFIEKFSSNCSFIATCNFQNRLMEPILSRFSVVDFAISADEKEDVLKRTIFRIKTILDSEGVKYDIRCIAKLIGKFYPDFRRILNDLQRYSVGGEIDSGIFASASDDYDTLIGYLKDRRWNDMRKWVAMQSGLDMSSICRTLYNRATEFMKQESLPTFTILSSEYQYKAAFVVDKEIHVVAFLTQVISNCEMI